MQTVEAYQQTNPHVFMDDIYVPSLTHNTKTAAEVLKSQKHAHDVDEMHRFLESNCDCV